MKRTFLPIAALVLFACGNNTATNDNKRATEQKNYTMTEKPFGTYEGKAIIEYTITNPSGMQVSIINYGGTVTRLITPDKNKGMGDVVLGFDSLSGYLQKANPYFGSLIGRYGNRIAAAKFTLDGKTYTLAPNNNGNTLHGGNKGFDKVVWTAQRLAGDSSLQLTYLSKDGEEGYPGNLTVKVIYTLTTDNGLKIDYTSTIDKIKSNNLTNQAYFN